MREGTISARLYTAAYLAALTISNGWRLVSFDHVFKHFGALQRLTLSTGVSSGQPTLIQLSDGLKFRILMQQGFCLVNPLDWQRLQLFIGETPTPLSFVFPNPVKHLHARDETGQAGIRSIQQQGDALGTGFVVSQGQDC